LTRNPSAPFALTHEEVRAIRAKLATPCAGCGRPHTLQSIARDYRVSAVTIHAIKHRRVYRKLEDKE